MPNFSNDRYGRLLKEKSEALANAPDELARSRAFRDLAQTIFEVEDQARAAERQAKARGLEIMRKIHEAASENPIPRPLGPGRKAMTWRSSRRCRRSLWMAKILPEM